MDLIKPVTGKSEEGIVTDAVLNFDYKNTETLENYVTERGKILPRRTTGLSRNQQKKLENAIKRARMLALLPSTIHNFKVNFASLLAERAQRAQAYDATRSGRSGYSGDHRRTGAYGKSKRQGPSFSNGESNKGEGASNSQES